MVILSRTRLLSRVSRHYRKNVPCARSRPYDGLVELDFSFGKRKHIQDFCYEELTGKCITYVQTNETPATAPVPVLAPTSPYAHPHFHVSPATTARYQACAPSSLPAPLPHTIVDTAIAIASVTTQTSRRNSTWIVHHETDTMARA